MTLLRTYSILDIVRRQGLTNIGKAVHMEEMTDKQFDKILKMVSMILDGCKNLDEAKEKVNDLLKEQKKED